MQGSSDASGLTSFQMAVARAFFSTSGSEAFLLAGGAALIAHELTERLTEDLDFFAPPASQDISAGRDALVAAATVRGWGAEVLRDLVTFCRVRVDDGDETCLVDLGIDSRPEFPPSLSFLGPTFAPEDLAARKTLALFSRAEARDFLDVFTMAQIYGREKLVEWATKTDAGFHRGFFAESLGSLRRHSDQDLQLGKAQADALRAYFDDWRRELTRP